MNKPFCQIMAMAFSLCFLTGCMATPATDAVASHMEEMVPADAVAPRELTVPEHVSLEKESLGCGSILFDADVYADLQDVPATFEVTPHEMTVEEVRHITELLTGPATAYQPYADTRAELTRRKSMLEQEATGAEADQAMLEYLEAAVEEAPEAITKVAFDWDSVPDWQAPGAGPYSVMLEGETGTARIHVKETVYRYSACKDVTSIPASWIDASYAFRPEAPEFPVEDARETAFRTLEMLGLAGYAILDDQTETCCFLSNARPQGYGYVFTATRTVGSQASVWPGNSWWTESCVPAVVAPWDTEAVTIWVGKDGIMALSVQGASDYGIVPEQQARMVPFDIIVENAKKQLLYLFATDDGDTGSEESVVVHDIRLVRGTIQQKDRPANGISVPLWMFTFTHTVKDADIVETYSIFINAVDGAYVNPRVTLAQIS